MSRPAPTRGAEVASVVVYEQLEQARSAWRQLEETAPHAVFQTWQWLDPWQRHVGAPAGISPLVAVAWDPRGAPLVVWPMGRVSHGPMRVLTGLGGALSDYQGPLVAPAALAASPAARAALWDQVLGALPLADVARFHRIPASLGGHAHPLLAGRVQRAPADSHAVELPASWDALYRDRCSSRTRASNRRKLKKLARHGEVVFEVAETASARLALLPTALALKSAGYARLGVEDLFAHPGRRAMLEELARQPASPLHVSALRVGGVVRASHVGAVYGGTLSFLFPGYLDDALAAQSPGAELCRRAEGSPHSRGRIGVLRTQA